MLRLEQQNHHIFISIMLCGLGFIGVVFAFTFQLVNEYATLKNESLLYSQWASMSLAPNKTAFVLSYLAITLALFVYLSLAIFFSRIMQKKCAGSVENKLGKPSLQIFLLVINLSLFFAFIKVSHFNSLIFLLIGWVLLLLFPIKSHDFFIALVNTLSLAIRTNRFYQGLMIMSCMLFCMAFFPFLGLSSLKVSNDYLWVPEKTVLKEGVVDNNHFIMMHGLGGLYKDSLIKSKNDLNLSQYHYITVYPIEITNQLPIIAINQYDYLPNINALFIKKPKLTSLDKENFCAFSNGKHCEAINQLYHSKLISQSKAISINEFIKKNKYELSSQILAGHYFHHQNAMLGPINEQVLGKDSKHINFLYGFGNTHFLTYIFTHIWPKLTFENFTFTLYSFYFIYFLFFIACCHIIFHDIRYTAITTASVIGLYFLIGFEAIRIAPGFNPLRHLLDLPLLLSLYGYLNSQRYQLLFLILGLFFGLLAVYANQEFGLMMFTSFFGATSLHLFLSKKKYLHFIFLGAGFLTLAAMLVYINTSLLNNGMGLYSLLGVSVSPSGRKIVLILSLGIFLCYAGLFTIYAKRGATYSPLYLCVFLFFYSQCLWIYYVWYTDFGHLLSTSPIWGLFFIMMYRELASIFGNESDRDRLMLVGTAAASLVLLLGSFQFFSQQLDYHRIFKTHVVYQWNFPNAHFKSSMDPHVFQEAVKLIRAYSPDNSIYLISKYDNFLPFIAGKFSAMPYLELSTSMVTDKEVNQAADVILQEKPKYLFVDSDILSTNTGDILDPMNALTAEIDTNFLSLGRVSVLNESKRVFKKVASQYKLIATGYLVSVYEHI